MEEPPPSSIDLCTNNVIESTISAGDMPHLPLPPPPIQTLDQHLSFCLLKVDDHARAGMMFDEIPQRSSDTDLSGSTGSQREEKNIEPLESSEILERFQDNCTSQPSSHCMVLDSTNNHVDETEEWISRNRSDTEVDEPLVFLPPGSSSWYDDMVKRSMVAAGLANLGNTCFLNAVLQCFTHTVLLIKGLYSYTHVMPCDCNGQRFCLVCALWEHIDLSLSSTSRIVSPLRFVDNLSYFSSTFQRFQQEDAHEFMQCLLDRLESSCFFLKADDYAFTSQNLNLVKQVFGGRVVSKLRCCNCNHCSDTYEPSVDLSLEIEDANKLSTALDSFTKVERLEDEDMSFTCEKCNQKVSIEKQLMLDQIPLVCALHLKRFKNYGCYVEKIDKHVEFPVVLDLQRYSSSSQASNVDMKYDLYALIVHEAITSTCGHYYCYIRYAPGLWYKFDDSKVIKVSEQHVLSEEAYMLFYTKQGTPFFSNFMETCKLVMDQTVSNNSPKSVLEIVDYHCTSPSTSNNSSHNTIEGNKDDASTVPGSLDSSKCNGTEVAGSKDTSQSDHQLEVQSYAGAGSMRHDGHAVFDSKDDQNGVFSTLLGSNYHSVANTSIDIDNAFSPPTPPRSLNIDVSEDMNSVVVFAPNDEQSKLVKKTASERQQSLDVDDASASYCHVKTYKQCRKLSGARGNSLRAALDASCKGKGSLRKTGMKMASSRRKKGSHSKHRHRNLLSRKLSTFGLR